MHCVTQEGDSGLGSQARSQSTQCPSTLRIINSALSWGWGMASLHPALLNLEGGKASQSLRTRLSWFRRQNTSLCFPEPRCLAPCGAAHHSDPRLYYCCRRLHYLHFANYLGPRESSSFLPASLPPSSLCLGGKSQSFPNTDTNLTS